MHSSLKVSSFDATENVAEKEKCTLFLREYVVILEHQNCLRTNHTTAKHSVMNSVVCCLTTTLPFQQHKNDSILILPATEVVTGSVP